jgi:hypothetical protein
MEPDRQRDETTDDGAHKYLNASRRNPGSWNRYPQMAHRTAVERYSKKTWYVQPLLQRIVSLNILLESYMAMHS